MKYNGIKILTKEDTGSEPVTLAEVKEHLLKTDTDSDTYLTFLISACRQEIEGIYNVSLVDKTITAKVINMEGNQELLYPPVTSITSLTDLDSNDIEFDETNLILDTCFDLGLIEYETEAAVTDSYKLKILQLIADKFAHRGDAEKPAHKGSWLI